MATIGRWPHAFPLAHGVLPNELAGPVGAMAARGVEAMERAMDGQR